MVWDYVLNNTKVKYSHLGVLKLILLFVHVALQGEVCSGCDL